MYETTPLHEAGHAVAADALGCKVRLASAVPGESFSGICRYLAPLVRDTFPRSVEAPFVTWGAGWQRRLAADVVILLAGETAEELFGPRPVTRAVRLPESIAAQVNDNIAELAAAGPAATAEDLAEAARSVNEPGKSDAEQVASIAFTAHGGDPLRTAAWLHWLSEECRALLLQHEQAVRRMAALLLEHGVVGEQAAAACLRGGKR